MKTNRTILFIIAAILMIGIANAAISNEPNIKATLLSQNPDPVAPGRYVELRFQIENLGTAQADNLVFELNPEYPFSLDPGVSPQIKLGTFYGRSIGTESATLYYKLKVDPNALEGLNTVKLGYSIDGGDSWALLDTFEIRVQASDPQIAISSVSTSPERLEPGKNAKLTVTVSNMADSFIQDVSVKLDLSSSTLPFAPVNSVTEQKAKTITAGNTMDFGFDLITMGDAVSNIYKVPITLRYHDSAGNLHNKSDYISIIVGTAPDIQVMLDSQSFYTAGVAGDVSIKFVNKGVTNAKFMNVQILPSDSFELLSADTVYIGKLDSDDFETADFKIFVKPTSEKIVGMPMQITYTDSNNQAYEQKLNIPIKMYSGAELKKFGLVKGSNMSWIFFLVVVAGVGYYIYRKKKKAKK
jgi:hypothetical protein